MEKYLLDLVKNNIRVIIPDFGALIVSTVNEKTAINFNSYLKFNDGMLIGHISNEEGIDSIAASKKVEEFVKNITDTLNQGNKFTINGLGVFSKEISGGIKFSQNEKDVLIENNPEEKKVIVDSPLEINDDLIDIEVQSSEFNVQSSEFNVQSSEFNVQSSEFNVQSSEFNVQSSEFNVQSSEFKVQGSEFKIQDSKPDNENPKPETLNPKPETLNPKPETLNPKPETLNPNSETLKPHIPDPVLQKHIPEQKNTNNSFPIWIPIVIIAVLLLLAAAYYFYIDERTFQIFKKQTVEVVIPEVIEEPEVEIEEIIETVIVEPVVFPQHHIIVGSFKEQIKAEQLLDKLHNKGYSQATIFERNGFIMVSAEWHSSVNKALERQEVLLDELRIDNWVLSLKKQ